MGVIHRVRALGARFADERPGDPLLVRCARRLLTADSRDRVFVLAGQAFIALVPLLIIVATLASSRDSNALGHYFVDRFSLTGVSADSVLRLFQRPPDVASGVSMLSVLILLISINGFARSLRQTLERAWELPQRGVRGSLNGGIGLIVMLLMIATLGWIGGSLNEGWIEWVLSAAMQSLVAVFGWLLLMDYFLSRRVARRELLPGALFGAGALVVANVTTGLYLPVLIVENAERYGPIGIAFALVSWLIIYATLIVCVAVFAAQLVAQKRTGGERISRE